MSSNHSYAHFTIISGHLFANHIDIFHKTVYKTRYVSGLEMSTSCQRSYPRKCQYRGVGGQKKTNLVNVVCERPLIAGSRKNKNE